MKFFCISDPLSQSYKLLKSSALKRGLEFITIDVESFNFVNYNYDLSEKYLIYRILTSIEARKIEKLLLNENAISFHKDYESSFQSIEDRPLFYEKKGFPIPKTVHTLTNNKSQLKDYVEYLGGFPIIIKSLGRSHGVGVIKVDSYSSLYSIADYLLTYKDNYVMREYIDFIQHGRLIVIGDKVVDSTEYLKQEGDFRTNAVEEIKVIPYKFKPDIEKASVDIIRSLSLEFGGVDVLIDEDNFYIAEANFPCFFPRCQIITQVDISGMMVDYLINKAQSNE